MFKLINSLFRILFLLIIIASIAIAYARYIEPHMLQTKEITLKYPDAPEQVNDITIALFADTHFGDYYNLDDFSKVQDSLQKMKPDIIVFAGDLIDNYDTYSDNIYILSEKLAEIDAPYGKYAIFGNHDYGGGAENEYMTIMEDGGFTVLKNDCFIIDELEVSIIGIDDVIIGYGDPEITSRCDSDNFNIILSHAPDVIDHVINNDVDLMLSGHTHGRQINIKYFDEYILPSYGRKYVKGLYEFNNIRSTKLYVNSGVGMTKMPFRFLSPPELSYITIKN